MITHTHTVNIICLHKNSYYTKRWPYDKQDLCEDS